MLSPFDLPHRAASDPRVVRQQRERTISFCPIDARRERAPSKRYDERAWKHGSPEDYVLATTRVRVTPWTVLRGKLPQIVGNIAMGLAFVGVLCAVFAMGAK